MKMPMLLAIIRLLVLVCVFISRTFTAGDSDKDTKSGNEKRRNE